MPVSTTIRASLLIALASTAPRAQESDERAALPNVLVVLADDLGYGDVSCYNDEAKVATPNIDRLAAEGMRFTDAHSPSTVCTPTRYGLLTGHMPFRLGYRGVFTGAGGPCLIADGRLTLPGMLRERGYRTACVGKWHVGLTFYDEAGAPIEANGLEAVRRIDYARPMTGGPLDQGFDEFFGTASCPTTDWLYAWIEGDRVPVPPVEQLDRATLPKHPYANDCRRGLVAPDFDLERVDLVLLEKSRAFLERHARESPDQPFFLYHSAQAVHLPSFAAEEFEGKSGAGPHGDFIHELDWIVGELMATLERLELADDTLVVFTSDNGPETTTAVHMRGDHGHDGARPWRGLKRDQWEGGHRVPMIARWPGRVAAGSTSDQIFGLVDVMATVAALVDYELPRDAAEDSYDFSGALLGEATEPVREHLISQTISLALAVRRGRWKLLDHRGSGGNDYSRAKLEPFALVDTAPEAPGQLYDLAADPGETVNLWEEEPEVVAELRALLAQLVESGRSAP